MRKTRTIVAVTLLATALCADRAVASSAAQGPRDDARPVARSFAQRLTVSLRRVVPAMRFQPSRLEGLVAVSVIGGFDGAQARVHEAQGTPFEFRLPPPAL